MNRFDIAIHGAGLVGQSLALHLASRGFKVALIGRSSQPSSPEDVRAFALGHAAKAWLEPIGAWSQGSDTTPVTNMLITGDTRGGLEFQAPVSTASSSTRTDEQQPLNWIVEVPQLATRLAQLVTSNTAITQLTASSAQAALHVVCDRRSDFWQTQLQPHAHSFITTTPYGQQAIAAKLASTQPHQHTARQWFNEAGEVLALLPTGGKDGSTYALVWSLVSSRAQELVQADPSVFLEQLNLESLKSTPTDASGAPSLTLTSPRALWPLNLSTVDIWSGATPHPWVLAGDAAHTVHPLAGQGLNLGFGDAARLAQRLIALRDARGTSLAFTPTTTQLQRVLRSYTRERKAAVAGIASVTDGLHLLYARQNTVIRQLRNVGMNAVNNLSFAKQWLIQKAQS